MYYRPKHYHYHYILPVEVMQATTEIFGFWFLFLGTVKKLIVVAVGGWV